jgi:predicted AAA+ superfamily ATPase
MAIDWQNTLAAIWRQRKEQLHPVTEMDTVSLDSLLGIDLQKQRLKDNTYRFINGLPANSALLWGSRGTGKSSLVKAILNEYKSTKLRLIEVYKSDLACLPEIVDQIRDLDFKFIIYCDDVSFDDHETSYIVLKSLLDGSIEPPPKNTIMYATSNRRHLMPEYQADNQASKVVDGEIHYSDAIEEKISLSDRFGLWLSFYPQTINEYLDIVDSYFVDYQGDRTTLHNAAKEFAAERGSKSGRTAKQFFNSYS